MITNKYEAPTILNIFIRFHAAKAYEEAGLMFMKMGKLDKFSSNFDHASNLYLEDGTPDTAAMCLVRAG